jgi:hypothetical protein
MRLDNRDGKEMRSERADSQQSPDGNPQSLAHSGGQQRVHVSLA